MDSVASVKDVLSLDIHVWVLRTDESSEARHPPAPLYWHAYLHRSYQGKKCDQ